MRGQASKKALRIHHILRRVLVYYFCVTCLAGCIVSESRFYNFDEGSTPLPDETIILVPKGANPYQYIAREGQSYASYSDPDGDGGLRQTLTFMPIEDLDGHYLVQIYFETAIGNGQSYLFCRIERKNMYFIVFTTKTLWMVANSLELDYDVEGDWDDPYTSVNSADDLILMYRTILAAGRWEEAGVVILDLSDPEDAQLAEAIRNGEGP